MFKARGILIMERKDGDSFVGEMIHLSHCSMLIAHMWLQCIGLVEGLCKHRQFKCIGKREAG